MAVLTMVIASFSVQWCSSTIRCPPKLKMGNDSPVLPKGLVSTIASYDSSRTLANLVGLWRVWQVFGLSFAEGL